MRPEPDLMERLTAADPLRGDEALGAEERREADELLAALVATPVSPERRTARRPRRWAVAAVATACVALAAFVAANLLDEEAPGPNVIALAVAAVSADDVIYHTFERKHVDSTGSLPEDRTIFYESWRTRDGRQHQKWFTSRDGRRGRFVSEFAGRRVPGRMGGPMLIWDVRTNSIMSSRFGSLPGSSGAPSLDPYGDPGAGMRALEAQGRLRVAGTTDVDGTRAYRLVSGPVEGVARGKTEQIEYLVDAETYLPLASRFTESGRGDRLVMSTHYLVYERLPINDRTLGLLDLDPHPGAKCAPGAGDIMGRGTLGFPNPCAR